MERSYIAFISYKHAERDAAIAKTVHSLIENYVVPKSLRKGSRKLGIVFRDEEELPISNDLTESICTALDASRYLIVICSPEAKESPWVAREVEYFLRNHDPRDAFVVLANGEPNDVFPYALTHVINPETGECQEVEPLAMDARGDTISASVRKVRSSIKKLYAAMLGCSYDSLVQREKTRRMKRIAALISLAVLVASCFAGVLLVKNRELSQKNDQLTAAITLALQRESQLLADEADEALENGDTTTAIKYAGDALYSADVERPYHAPAERVLFSAFDILEEQPDQIALNKVPLEHAAPIEMLSYSDDGRMVYTIDVYGTVSGFDASSGNTVFSVKLRENGGSFLAKSQLCYNAPGNSLICHYSGLISALDASTGALLWEYEPLNNIANGMFFEPKGQRIAFVEREYTPMDDDLLVMAYEHNFIVLSAADGTQTHTIPLPGAMDPDYVEFPTSQRYWASGKFADADRFVGTLFRKENNIAKSLLYVVDLEQNSVRYIENETLESDLDMYHYMGTFNTGENRALVIGSDGDLHMRYFDLEAGELLWETTADADFYVAYYEPCYLLYSDEVCIIAVGKNMYVVDKATGGITSSVTLYDEIIDLYPLKNGLFGFALENGYCAAGWKNAYGLFDSQSYSAVVDLPSTPQIAVYNGGFVQPHYTDDQLDAFNILPLQEGGGSICYLSEDKCTAFATTVLPSPKLPEPTLIEAQGDEVSSHGSFCDADEDGRVLLKGARQGGDSGLTIVDTVKGGYTFIRLDDTVTFNSDSYYLMEDGQHIIANRENGIVYRIAPDGSTQTLAENKMVTLATSGDMNYVSQLYAADAARRSSDGTLITARCTGEQINLWTDGENEISAEIPEDVRWAVVDGLSIYSLFRVGENGLLVLSDYASDESRQFENFAVYDPEGKTWKLIADAAGGSDNRLIAFGEGSPVFAVYDEDMHIRIYDWNAAEPVQSIRTDLPLVSVVKTGMLMNDRYMYILTKDGQFMIYSLETGAMVSRTIFTSVITADQFCVWFDAANSRLYCGLANETRCMDVRSWEQLFCYRGNDQFKFYSPEQNAAYMSRYDSDTSLSRMRAVPIPPTEEMIRIAQEVLR